MVAHNWHGKTKSFTAKSKTSRQNQKPHGKNKIPHGKTKNRTAKTKYLTAKPKTSRQNQKLHNKNKIALFLPWGFRFCRDVFVFTVRFLVLPWQLWATVPLDPPLKLNGFTFQIINSWMESWTRFDCNSSFRNLSIILSDLRFHNTFLSSWNMVLQPNVFFTAFSTERSQRAFTSKFFIICSC